MYGWTDEGEAEEMENGEMKSNKKRNKRIDGAIN
jgi:hypothetical protein